MCYISVLYVYICAIHLSYMCIYVLYICPICVYMCYISVLILLIYVSSCYDMCRQTRMYAPAAVAQDGNTFVHLHTSACMLTYADVRMLTYADVCRMATHLCTNVSASTSEYVSIRQHILRGDYVGRLQSASTLYLSAYCYISVRILLCVSSNYYMCTALLYVYTHTHSIEAVVRD
jgi:hypothetical protein